MRPCRRTSTPRPPEDCTLERLTSTRNPRVQAIKRLHRRSARVAERRFVVEGPQAVREALASGSLTELYASDLDSPLVEQARSAQVPVVPVSEPVLEALAETRTPQGLVGVAPLLDVPLHDLPERPQLIVVVHAIADPGNAGTVLRTADAAGADAVVFTEGSVDPHSGKAVRASAGSLWHLPVVSGPPLVSVLQALRERGLQVLATTGGGQQDVHRLGASGALDAPTAWLLGNEAHGLDAEALEQADRRVRIAIRGRAESLNLAAAAAVCLFESARAHSQAPRADTP